jgi:O-antigen/teichoic acid export membrane protein
MERVLSESTTALGSVQRHFFWVASANVLPALIMLSAYPSLVGLIGLDNFALYSTALVIIAYSQVFEFGLARTTVVYTAQLRGAPRILRIRGHFGLAWLIGLAAISITTALLITFFPSFPILPTVLLPWVVLDTLVARSVIEGLGLFRYYALTRIVANGALTLLPLVYFSFFSFAQDELLWILITVKAVESISLRVRASYALEINLGIIGKPQLETLSQNIKVSFSVLTGSFFGIFDRMMVSSSFGTAALGLYSVSADIVSRYGIIAGSVTTVILPRLATSSNGQERSRTLRTSLILLSAVGVVSLAAIYVLGPFYFLLVDEEQTGQFLSIALILTSGAVANSISGVCLADLHSRLIFGPPALAHGIEAVVLITILLVWAGPITSQFGLLGIASLWAGRSIVDLAIMGFLSCKTT